MNPWLVKYDLLFERWTHCLSGTSASLPVVYGSLLAFVEATDHVMIDGWTYVPPPGGVWWPRKEFSETKSNDFFRRNCMVGKSYRKIVIHNRVWQRRSNPPTSLAMSTTATKSRHPWRKLADWRMQKRIAVEGLHSLDGVVCTVDGGGGGGGGRGNRQWWPSERATMVEDRDGGVRPIDGGRAVAGRWTDGWAITTERWLGVKHQWSYGN